MKFDKIVGEQVQSPEELVLASLDCAFDFTRLNEPEEARSGFQFRVVSVTERPVQVSNPTS